MEPPPIQRPDLRVIARVLEAMWRSQAPLRRSRLQQASGTNYTQFSRYLDLMVGRGLLELQTDASSVVWVRLTPKGYEAHRFLVTGLHEILRGSSPPWSGLGRDRPR